MRPALAMQARVPGCKKERRTAGATPHGSHPPPYTARQAPHCTAATRAPTPYTATYPAGVRHLLELGKALRQVRHQLHELGQGQFLLLGLHYVQHTQGRSCWRFHRVASPPEGPS